MNYCVLLHSIVQSQNVSVLFVMKLICNNLLNASVLLNYQMKAERKSIFLSRPILFINMKTVFYVTDPLKLCWEAYLPGGWRWKLNWKVLYPMSWIFYISNFTWMQHGTPTLGPALWNAKRPNPNPLQEYHSETYGWERSMEGGRHDYEPAWQQKA